MAVDDLWFLRRTGPDGKRMPSKRYGRGKRWRVRYVDDMGRERTRLFPTKGQAEVFDVSVRTDVARGLYVDPVGGRETVRSYARRWAAAQLYRASTADRVERAIELHIAPTLGSLPLAQVRPSHVQSWVRGLDLAPTTVRVVFSVLAAMFTAAVRDRLIAVSPCVGITLPALPHGEHTVLTPAQVRRLADVMPSRYRAAVWLGAGCGLRISEVLGLELEHVHHLRRTLEVRQQIATAPGQQPWLAPPKTRTSRRTVEVPTVVLEAIARQITVHPPRVVDMLDRTDPRRERVRPARLLFTTEDGRPVTRSAFGHVWRTAREDADLPPDAVFHSLRHHYASLLISGGASVKAVQIALGHASPTITLNTYVGMWPDAVDRTRSLIDAAFAETARTAARS